MSTTWTEGRVGDGLEVGASHACWTARKARPHAHRTRKEPSSLSGAGSPVLMLLTCNAEEGTLVMPMQPHPRLLARPALLARRRGEGQGLG